MRLNFFDTFGASYSVNYDWAKPKSVREASDNNLLVEINQIYALRPATYCNPPMVRDLQDREIRVGHNRLTILMRKVEIFGRTKRRYKVHITDINYDQPIVPNHPRDIALLERPNQVWVSDITYISTHEGWLYLSGVLDRYSRKLVGWSIDSTLHTGLTLSAFKMAMIRRKSETGFIHNSYRCIQYTHQDCQSRLDENIMIASMFRIVNCYDNATMKSFCYKLKHELVFHCTFRTSDEAKAVIFVYIEDFYNQKRSHSSLVMKVMSTTN